MTAQQSESATDRTVRLALTAGRHTATLARVRALHETWVASPDPFARRYADQLGEALNGTGRDWARGMDYDAIHDHVGQEEV